MINKTLFSIFREGSKTYFYSSIFFPSYLKKDVFALYGFVRKADNYIDAIPQDVEGFNSFKKKYYAANYGEATDDIVVNLFADLVQNNDFDPKWVDAFFCSMEMDIRQNIFQTIEETIDYIYGSAEVIGLMMAKIMNLPKESYDHARYLGRSMQYINFIRDIAEDVQLDRNYFPQQDMREFGLTNLTEEEARNKPDKFKGFLTKQLERYCEWQKTAEKGYTFIPKRYLIPVKTASEMYNWTADQIQENPFIVYDVKVKPNIAQIVTTSILNMVDPKKPNKPQRACLIKKVLPKIDY